MCRLEGYESRENDSLVYRSENALFGIWKSVTKEYTSKRNVEDG
jgi:hypothetical protein